MTDQTVQTTEETRLRHLVARMIGWGEAHVTLDEAVQAMPPELRSARPADFPHSVWDLVEHIRISQRDILEFSGSDSYQTREWPQDFWPDAGEEVDDRRWNVALEAIRRDREALSEMVRDESRPLLEPVPHGEGEQTLLREIFLVADHAAYHVGQIVAVRKALGCWPDRR